MAVGSAIDANINGGTTIYSRGMEENAKETEAKARTMADSIASDAASADPTVRQRGKDNFRRHLMFDLARAIKTPDGEGLLSEHSVLGQELTKLQNEGVNVSKCREAAKRGDADGFCDALQGLNLKPEQFGEVARTVAGVVAVKDRGRAVQVTRTEGEKAQKGFPIIEDALTELTAFAAETVAGGNPMAGGAVRAVKGFVMGNSDGSDYTIGQAAIDLVGVPGIGKVFNGVAHRLEGALARKALSAAERQAAEQALKRVEILKSAVDVADLATGASDKVGKEIDERVNAISKEAGLSDPEKTKLRQKIEEAVDEERQKKGLPLIKDAKDHAKTHTAPQSADHSPQPVPAPVPKASAPAPDSSPATSAPPAPKDPPKAPAPIQDKAPGIVAPAASKSVPSAAASAPGSSTATAVPPAPKDAPKASTPTQDKPPTRHEDKASSLPRKPPITATDTEQPAQAKPSPPAADAARKPVIATSSSPADDQAAKRPSARRPQQPTESRPAPLADDEKQTIVGLLTMLVTTLISSFDAHRPASHEAAVSEHGSPADKAQASKTALMSLAQAIVQYVEQHFGHKEAASSAPNATEREDNKARRHVGGDQNAKDAYMPLSSVIGKIDGIKPIALVNSTHVGREGLGDFSPLGPGGKGGPRGLC
jgi:hypothetical protein